MPVKIFCCYAHKDEPLLKKLKTHLSPLQRQDLIDIWHDRDISAGTEWEQEVSKHLNEAQIILLLISPHFLASEYCYSIEMMRAIERHKAEEARVIPVILRPAHWENAPFGKLQALPANGKPITDRSWQNQDKAFLDVVRRIQETVKEIKAVSSPPPGQRVQRPPTGGEGKAAYIDGYLEAVDQQLFWRYFVPCVLRLSLRLLCHDRPDTIAGLIMPLGADTSTSELRPEELSMVGESLIGWLGHNSSFSIFHSATPAFEHPGDFRVFPLRAEGEDAPKGHTLMVVQRNTKLPALSVPVVETIQRILAPIYEDVQAWKPYFMRDSLHPAIDFYRSTTPPDPLLNGLADMIVRLGGQMTDGRDRWRFCCIVLPKETGLPLVWQSLVIQGQSKHGPHRIGESTVPPEEAPRSMSLRAYQSGCIVYRHKVGKEDPIRSKLVEGDFRSAIALPVGGENGTPVAVIYAVSDEVDAFSLADQRVMRMLGRIIEELLVTYSAHQRGATRLMNLIEDPSTVDPSFLDFSSDNEFVRDVEALLWDIKGHMKQDKPSAEKRRSVSFLAIDVDNVGGLARQYGDRIMKNLGREVGYRIRRQLLNLLEDYEKFRLYYAYADRFYVVLRDISREQAGTYAERLRSALRGDYKVEAYGIAAQQPAQPTLTAITVRLSVSFYPYSHLEQLLRQYPEETAVVDARACISRRLDNALKEGSDRGGDRVVFEPNALSPGETRSIRILFLAANPKDTHSLRLDEEIRSIDISLRQAEFRDRFDIKQHWALRVTDLQGYLLRHRPDIVHFSGHGSPLSEIILEDNNGKSHPVSPRALSQVFSVLKDNVRCVVLNACYSEHQAQAIAQHIDCVVGMSKAIGDTAAISFAAAFYQALGYGRNVKTAFDLGCAQIDLENLDEQDTPKLLALNCNPVDITFVANNS